MVINDRAISAPQTRPDLLKRLRRHVELVGQRLPSRARRVIDRSPPRLALVEDMGEDEADTLGRCIYRRRRIELLIPFVDSIDNAGLRGLIGHELAHWFRYVSGEDHENLNREEDEAQVAALLQEWGFTEEMTALYDSTRAWTAALADGAQTC